MALSYNELQTLSRLIVQEQANNPEWMAAYVKAQSQLQNKEERLVSAKEAAARLGISVWLLYRIKDDENGRPQFSYRKGASQSSPLRFNAATLMEEYDRYLAKNRAAKHLTIHMPLAL